MKRILTFLLGIFTICLFSKSQTLKADFTADECIKVLYSQGFDKWEELDGWTLTSLNSVNTWHLNSPRKADVPAFTSINPLSDNSLAIFYDAQSQQKEVLVSPEFLVKANSFCSFYACFDGVFVLFANFTLEVLNVETEEKNTLFNAFLWSQEEGHEKPKWLSFKFDLTEYTGKRVKFLFTYEGIDGDDFLLDDFCISQMSDDENAVAEIKEGEDVHFKDLSTGNPTHWEWHFGGGIPETSIEENPVVNYQKSGIYPVKLVIKGIDGESECIKENFVVVKGVAPVAAIGWPEGGYLSPYMGIFVPIGVELQFTDQSKNLPTTWEWAFPGSTQEIATDQHPKVYYDKEGVYNVTLQVSNATGRDLLVQENFLQAGGEQYIWNIEIEESGYIDAIPLGWYGYYGGTNWLGMEAFAEYFNKPLEEGYLSEVGVYFAYTGTITPEAPITVSIAKAENGLPGEKLVSSTLMARDLKYDEKVWVVTDFKFDSPIEIKEEFFVIIEGFPNNSSDRGEDNIAMGCTTTRSDKGKSTVYHLLELEDDNYQPTGEYKWFKNEDEDLSFAITPLFAYKEGVPPLGINDPQQINTSLCSSLAKDYIEWTDEDKIEKIWIYSLSGQLLYSSEKPLLVDVSKWERGSYLVRGIKENKIVVQKVQFIP